MVGQSRHPLHSRKRAWRSLCHRIRGMESVCKFLWLSHALYASAPGIYAVEAVYTGVGDECSWCGVSTYNSFAGSTSCSVCEVGEFPQSTIDIQMHIEIPGSHSSLNATYAADVVDLFESQSVFPCADLAPGDQLCQRTDTISVQHVAADAPWNDQHSAPSRFNVVVQSVLPGTTELIQQQMSDQYDAEEIYMAIALSPRLFRVLSYNVQYNANRHVFFRCGDGVPQSCEQCDDGNTVDGDGCSATCTIEATYMCRNSRRLLACPDEIGVMVEWQLNVSTQTHHLREVRNTEACTGDMLCRHGQDVWQSELWDPLYTQEFSIPHPSPASGNYASPPSGVYCADFCTDTFVPPRYYEFVHSCQPSPINECLRGTSNCHADAFCIEPPGGVGFECQCDERFFVTGARGTGCIHSGIQLVFNMVGTVLGGAGALDYEQNFANMVQARLDILSFFVDNHYVKTKSPSATTPTEGQLLEGEEARARQELVDLLLEGVFLHNIEMIQAAITDASSSFQGRSLWRVTVRFPSDHIDISTFVSTTIFTQAAVWESILNSSTQYSIHTGSRCANDMQRGCAGSEGCVDGDVCVAGYPEIDMQILSTGGAASPIQVEASGLEIKSVQFDEVHASFKIRVRFNDAIANVMNVLYVSRVSNPLTAESIGTFNPEDFPCQPAGEGPLRQLFDSTVCCLEKVNQLYTTVAAFGEYIQNSSLPMQREISRQNACASLRRPPSNHTSVLVDTQRDFVSGAFSGMLHSRADLDPSPTRGYKDVMLTLSLDDMQHFGSIKTPLARGYRLLYFVGMAHIKTTDSDRMTVSYSQNEIASDVTTGYSYTSSPSPGAPGVPSARPRAQTPLIRDMRISLRDVKRRGLGPGGSSYRSAKFASLQIVVPPDYTVNNVLNFIPHSSLQASVGFALFDAKASVDYPCLHLYTGARKIEIDTLLDEQQWCMSEESICKAKDSAVVGPGGIIDFTIPLDDAAWADDLPTSNQFFYQSLFVSFLLLLQDEQGFTHMANVQTQTEIRHSNVVYMCREQKVASDLHDVLSVDVFLGLVGEESLFNESLVQSYDITRQSTIMPYVSRAVSAKESNVMSLVVRGDDGLFSQDFALEYTLVVEDMVSVHFIDKDKMTLVQSMIQAGTAFTTQRADPASSESLTRMTASQALLDICPMHRVPGQFGCITRREITARKVEMGMGGIVNFAPDMSVAPPTSNGDAISSVAQEVAHLVPGLWTQTVLGDSEYARELGQNHSRIMSKRFALNSRYRNAYMLSPTMDWGQDSLEHQEVQSVFDLTQFSITTMLFSLDTNLGAVYTPRVQLLIPSLLYVSFSQLVSLQGQLAEVYAFATNLPAADVHLDMQSVLSVPSRRRRALLADTDETTAGIAFNAVLCFRGIDSTTARENANDIKKSLQDAKSLISLILASGVALIVDKTHAAAMPTAAAPTSSSPPQEPETHSTLDEVERVVDDNVPIAEPTDLSVCTDTPDWSLDIAPILGLDRRPREPGAQPRAMPMPMPMPMPMLLGCTTRAQGALVTMVRIRGPTEQSDWNKQDVESALHADSILRGWRWWDFCAAPPVMDLPQWSTGFQERWQSLQDILRQNCCLCHATPQEPGSFEPYVHRYSWPLTIGERGVYNVITHSTRSAASYDRANVLLLHPQIRNFVLSHDTKSTGRALGAITPLSEGWSIDHTGRTLEPPCPSGTSLTMGSTCSICPMGTYRTNSSVAPAALYALGIPLPYTGGGPCVRCPANSVSPAGSQLSTACACVQGSQLSRDLAGCELCPVNMYKNTTGNHKCISCDTSAPFAWAGSTSSRHCVQHTAVTVASGLVHTPASSAVGSPGVPNVAPATGQQMLYAHTLGMLACAAPLDVSHLPHAGGSRRRCQPMCEPTAGGKILACNTVAYNMSTCPIRFSTTDNALRVTDVSAACDNPNLLAVQQQATAPATRLQISATPDRNTVFMPRGVDRTDLKEKVAQVALLLRPGYMGPAPAGFVDEVAVRPSVWPHGSTVETSLRLRVKNTDLSVASPAKAIYMVRFLSSKRLDTSPGTLDWQWIVCGRKTKHATGPEYSFCTPGPDPDNPAEQNMGNPFVLDGDITPLHTRHTPATSTGTRCCETCYVPEISGFDCAVAAKHPDRTAMYERVLSWTPFSQPPRQRQDALSAGREKARENALARGSLWLYTFFTSGPSEACDRLNCNEAAVYRDIAARRDAASATAGLRSIATTIAIDFLPGTGAMFYTPESKWGAAVRALSLPGRTPLRRVRRLLSAMLADVPERKWPRMSPGKAHVAPVRFSQHLRVLLEHHRPAPLGKTTANTFSPIQSFFRENTAVHSEDSMVNAVCGGSTRYRNCDVLRAVISSPFSQFCAPETEYIQMIYPGFKHTILVASNFSVLDVTITSVMRSNSTRVCTEWSSRAMASGTPTRRLLASGTHEVAIHFVAMAQEPYALVLDWLLREGVGNISILTRRASVSASGEICDGSTSQSPRCTLLIPALVVMHTGPHPRGELAHDTPASPNVHELAVWQVFVISLGTTAVVLAAIAAFVYNPFQRRESTDAHTTPALFSPAHMPYPHQYVFHPLPLCEQHASAQHTLHTAEPIF